MNSAPRIARPAAAASLTLLVVATLAGAQHQPPAHPAAPPRRAGIAPAAATLQSRGLPPGRPRAITDSATVMYMVRALAHPRMEGRGAGTAGLDSAAALIAWEMAWLGLRPGGDDGTYFQRFEVTTGVAVGEPTAIAVGEKQFPVGDHFQPLGFSNNGTLTAPVVFAGYGITAPGFEYDDYAGIDVRDKLVLVLSNEPGEMDSTSRFDGTINTPHAEVRTKAINAREHGALGLLVVNGPRHHAGEPLRKPRGEGAGYMTSGLLAGYVSEQVASAILTASGLDLATLQSGIDAATRPHSVALTGTAPGTAPRTATITITLKRTRASIKNVVGWIPGRDTTRTLVVGAHYDHLGFGSESSLAPDSRLPHLGADDNASGVAAMLSVAGWQTHQARPERIPEHNLVFCAFAGEEMGLVGSSHFVDDPTLPLTTVEAMLNMDMVGRLRNNRLMVMGVGTATEFPALTTQVNERAAFDLKTSGDGYGPSDHSSFYKRKVPVLALFTGAHTDYHKPSDSAGLVDGDGLWRVALFARDLVDALDRGAKPTFQQAKSDSTVGRIAGGGGYGAYLGTIPDYMQTEGGVLLSGVRTSSPADSAGLKGGDVIVRFDGVRVDNIYDYTFALRSRKPGQQVRITVKRGESEVELLAVLGRRK